jgi:hypothetical protein
MEFRETSTHVIELTAEAAELADAYLQHGILSENFLNDARHIAIATVGARRSGSKLEFQAHRPF